MNSDILLKILNQSVDLICTIDREGRFTWLNEACFSVLGFQSNELTGRPFIEMVILSDQEKTKEIGNQIINGRLVSDFENSYIHKNGDIIALEWSAKWDESDQMMYCVARNKTEIQKAKKALQSSEDKYKYLFENNPCPMFIWDAVSLDILDCNAEALRKYGYSRDEFLQLNILDIRPVEEVPRILHAVENAKEIGPVSKNTWKHFRKTGELMLLEITSHLMIYNGKDAYLVVINDISEREKYLELLKENEEKLLKAQKIARLGFWQYSREDQTFYWSSEVFNIWKQSPDHFLPDLSAVLKTIHRDDVTFFENRLNAFFGQALPEEFEFRIITPEGDCKWILLTPEQHQNRPSFEKKLNATVQDISEKKQVQIQLEERNRFIETAIENIPIGIAVNKIDDGSVTLLNRNFTEIYGWPKNVLTDISSFFSNVYPDEQYRAEISSRILADIESNDINRMSWENINITTQAGEERIVNAKNIPLYDQNLMISTVVDVTHQKKAEMETRISYERYNYVTKATSDAIWDMDLINNTIVWGDGYQQIFGYENLKDSEVLEKWSMSIHPHDVDRVMNAFQQAIQGSENRYNAEYRFFKANGTYSFVSDKGFIIRDAEGKAIRMVGAMHDITQQKNEVLQKELFNEISQVFNETHQLSDSLQKVVDLIGKTANNYAMVELWMISEDESEINLVASYWGDKLTKEVFENALFYKRLKPGEGYPGKVWQTGSVISWNTTQNDPDFYRSKYARMAQLHSIFAIPLFNFQQKVGVLILGQKEDLMAEDRLFPFADKLGNHLGSEIKRKKLEYELQQVFTFSQDIICIAGLDGTFKKVNPATSKILEYSEKELLTISFSKMIHPEDLERTNQYLKSSDFHSGNDYFENRYQTKSGKIKWIAWTTSYSPVDELLFAVGKDITEQKNLQRLLDNATNLARIGGWEIDVVTKEVYWSPMTRSIYEVDADFQPDFENTYHFMASKKDEILLRRAFENAIQKGIKIDQEIQIISGRKNHRWVRIIGEPEAVGGVCFKISGSFQDIHDLKVAEIRSNQSKQRLISTLESIQDGFYELDKDWIITYWNNEAEKLLQKKREEVLGKNIWESLSDAISLRFYSEYQRALLEGIPVRFEEFYPPLQCWYDMSVFPSENGLTVFFKDITDRKKSEKDLLMFKMVMDNSIDGIGISDAEGNGIYINPEFQQMLGLPNEQLYQGTSPGHLYQDQEKAKEVFETLLSGNYWKGDVNLLNTKGDILPFYLSGGPIFNHRNKLIGIYGIHTDITERKIAENKLRQAFNEKNTILESIGDAFFSTDLEWTVTHWNRQAETLLGTPRELIVGKNLWEVFSDVIDTIFYKNYHKALETGMNISFEAFYEGVKKWFDVTAYPSVRGLSIYFRDITERKKGEQALNESNERFQKVSEATNDAIWDWDILNRSLYWGEGFNKLLRNEHATLVPDLNIWRNFIHPDDREAVHNSLQTALNDSSVFEWQFEYRFLRLDQEDAFVIDRGVIIRNDRGEAIRMVGALTDMTQRRIYEASLERLNITLDQRAKELALSNLELEEFAFVASHDLQEPLRMVTSFLTQLEKKYEAQLDSRGILYIQLAVDGAKRMRQIILDLLEYSRIGKESFKLENIDLNQVVEEIILLNKQVIEEKNAVIQFNELPGIYNHKHPVMQILQNLINNAIKYSNPKKAPEVTIEASSEGEIWLFSVRDNGIGIDEEYFHKIFVMFQRLHGRDEYEGTGIGLAVVKKTIDRMGGRIWVESQKGVGSTFFFTLPQAPQEL